MFRRPAQCPRRETNWERGRSAGEFAEMLPISCLFQSVVTKAQHHLIWPRLAKRLAGIHHCEACEISVVDVTLAEFVAEIRLVQYTP